MTLKEIWDNPLILTDVYNISHPYLKCNLDFDQSHIYNRAQPMVLYGFNETVRNILDRRITEQNVIDASEYAEQMGMGPFPEEIFMRIVKEFGGYLPLKVSALEDGTWVPKNTPFAKIENTIKGFGDLPTYFEAILLHSYFASSCATRAAYMKQYLLRNNMNIWRFHSFGFRGHNSLESAYWAGTAWNLFLQGTDDFHTKKHTQKAQIGSIFASAHKVEQQFDKELNGYFRAIDAAKSNGKNIVAIPIDTYDSDRFIDKYMELVANYGKTLGITVIFRPDSGETLEQAIHIHNKSTNLKLTNVGVIIGESVTFDRIKEDDQKLVRSGVPYNFVSWGVGAGFYKDLDRDWLGWAMKTSISNGKDRMKFSMDKIKQSIPGNVGLIQHKTEQGTPTSNMIITSNIQPNDLYRTIYNSDEKSVYIYTQTWDQIYEKCKTIDPDPMSMSIVSMDIQEKMEKLRKEYLG